MGGETTVRSFRMSEPDFERVKEAANLQGVKTSCFIRDSALMRVGSARTGPAAPLPKILTADQEQMIRGLVVNIRGTRGLLNQVAKQLNIYAISGSGSPPSFQECQAAIGNADEVYNSIKAVVADWGLVL